MTENIEHGGDNAGPEADAAPDRPAPAVPVPNGGQSIVAHRAITAPATVDRAARTVEVVWSTGARARNFVPALGLITEELERWWRGRPGWTCRPGHTRPSARWSSIPTTRSSRFRWRMEREQGTRAKPPRSARQPALPIPDWLEDELAEARERSGIVPLESNALALRLSTLRPGPDFAAGLAAAREADRQGALLEAPSAAERRLRGRVAELVAAQAVEDTAAGVTGPRGAGALGWPVSRLQRRAEARRAASRARR
ncbi:hypothetical protein [Falsiroseomonas sp.]|uniref:hypothetical protein n=1 Tax=Falsiroseomonas sp. TaxID=2870721 RepID=UPI003567FFC1